MQVTEHSQLSDAKSSREARAKRLKSLRKMTSLSRSVFSSRYGVPSGTLQNWESARFGGLTEKGAKTVLSAIRSEGIYCNFEWLMYGIGPGPQLNDKLFENTNNLYLIDKELSKQETDIDSQLATIAQELLVFRKLNPNAIDFVVRDNGMEPLFILGEYVAGCRRYQKDISTAIGQNCIIQTAAGDMLLRHLRQGSAPNLYTLLCMNPTAQVEQPVIYDVKLAYVAPIVWTRRKDPC